MYGTAREDREAKVAKACGKRRRGELKVAEGIEEEGEGRERRRSVGLCQANQREERRGCGRVVDESRSRSNTKVDADS